jgi:hypothetical protein
MKIAFYVSSGWPPRSLSEWNRDLCCATRARSRRLRHEIYVLLFKFDRTEDKYAIDLNKIDARASILPRLLYDLMTIRLASALRVELIPHFQKIHYHGIGPVD